MNTTDENQRLRYLLWLRHGCEMLALYGDDGEMQCNKCFIDFKRDSVERIEQRFTEINAAAWKEFLAKGKTT